MSAPPPLLRVEGLTVGFGLRETPVRVVRNLSFDLAAGQTLGIVGESGSGKTITALSIMGLQSSGARLGGSIHFEDEELLPHREARMTALRGKAMAMIFQEPMTALNPVHRIGDQIAEGLILHEGYSETDALKEATRLLERVGITQAAERLSAYPHEMSGGQRQRVMIAMALACRPELLIADEPTSALDVTVQAQLLDLIRDVVAERQMALIVISHDLGVVTELAARTLVLYGGAVMEEGETTQLFRAPAQPYTQGLVSAIPGRGGRRRRLAAIPGNVPPPHLLAPGCPFFGRCPLGDEICRTTPPPRREGASIVYCHKTGGGS